MHALREFCAAEFKAEILFLNSNLGAFIYLKCETACVAKTGKIRVGCRLSGCGDGIR